MSQMPRPVRLLVTGEIADQMLALLRRRLPEAEYQAWEAVLRGGTQYPAVVRLSVSAPMDLSEAVEAERETGHIRPFMAGSLTLNRVEFAQLAFAAGNAWTNAMDIFDRVAVLMAQLSPAGLESEVCSRRKRKHDKCLLCPSELHKGGLATDRHHLLRISELVALLPVVQHGSGIVRGVLAQLQRGRR